MSSFKFKVPKEMADQLKTFTVTEPRKINFYIVDYDDNIVCKGVNKDGTLIPFIGTLVDNPDFKKK